ncbi:MAG: tetratricopeptide repeat protein, partial [Terriglobia bacterium]
GKTMKVRTSGAKSVASIHKAKAVPKKDARTSSKPPLGKKAAPQKSIKPINIKKLQSSSSRKSPHPAKKRNGKLTPARAAILKQYETGVKLLYTQDFDKARVIFDKLIQTNAEDKELVERARIHIRLCEQKKPRKIPAPRSVDEHYDVAIALYNQGRYEETFEHLRKALKYDPSCHYVHYALAAANCKTGDLESALHDLQEAIQLKPENRFLAQRDEDFAPLKEDNRFITLVFPDRPGSATS